MKTQTSTDILFRTTGDSRIVQQARNALQQNRVCRIKSLSGSLKSLITANVWKQNPTPLLVIAPDTESAEQWYGDLLILLGVSSVALFAESEKYVAITEEHLDTRLVGLTQALNLLGNNDRAVVVAPAVALNYAVPAPESLHENTLRLHRGQNVAFDEFIYLLSSNGFDRKDYVGVVGDIAVRGGLIDVYPPGSENPLRIEFFGNEIDSIREFDPLSQRSIRELSSVSIIRHVFHNSDSPISATIFDYLPDDALLVVDSEQEIIANILHAEKKEGEDIPEEYIGMERFIPKISRFRRLELNNLGAVDFSVENHAQPSVNASLTSLVNEMRALALHDFTLVLCADGGEQLKRLRDLLENAFDIVGEDGEKEGRKTLASPEKTLRKIILVPFALNEGFIFPESKLAVFTEHQVFMRKKATSSRKISSKGITLRELQQLRAGDYVVHVDKGIARFDGLETISVGGQPMEAARLVFAEGDRMFLSLNYINRLQKYSAQEGVAPTLSKLGTGEWEKKKARTKKRLKDIARDLIKLYSMRKSQAGYAFPIDTLWQKEMEASFMYEDTPDQARATAEVKSDMEISTPMDRLVCGDVGFGKTEVAVRAAFKAVQAGKQVAVLVPTTILAQQHFSTFNDRLHRYAVNTDVISRFRSPAEQKTILERLERGKVDILIGTHRLLSKDVKFKDLGLLIVDEEQRFGVSAKEKLRAARISVDTLTLTATPIPRTLNFSLMGARDLSVIETPPRNRVPTHTEILVWNDNIIRKAMEVELARGGQIFIVNDKIADLELLSDRFRELVPNLRVGIAHGGMSADQIENVMRKFMERKLDCLVATKIIESGIDIPNVNTMFINRADKFGLAELYQLRGRVGRSNVQAHCYLLIPAMHTISKIAIRRLQAIEEFTELGSGFNLAMRDLEIRGAGNLLGAEQSGFIADIGFELYQKILDEAVQELKHEEFAELFAEKSKRKRDPKLVPNNDLTVEVEGEAMLPKSYISNDAERYEFYKKLYMAESEEELQPILDEMRDRFGALPEQARRMLDAVHLRISAVPCGFAHVSYKRHLLQIEFPAEEAKEYYARVFKTMIGIMGQVPNMKITPKGKKIYAECQVPSIQRAAEFFKRLAERTKEQMREEEAA